MFKKDLEPTTTPMAKTFLISKYDPYAQGPLETRDPAGLF